MADDKSSLPHLFTRLVDGLQLLMKEHLALARVEASHDLLGLARDGAWIGSATPLVIVGHALVCLGLTGLLARALGFELACVLVGVANLLGGVFLLRRGVKRVSERQSGIVIGAELRESVLAVAGTPPRHETPATGMGR